MQKSCLLNNQLLCNKNQFGPDGIWSIWSIRSSTQKLHCFGECLPTHPSDAANSRQTCRVSRADPQTDAGAASGINSADSAESAANIMSPHGGRKKTRGKKAAHRPTLPVLEEQPPHLLNNATDATADPSGHSALTSPQPDTQSGQHFPSVTDSMPISTLWIGSMPLDATYTKYMKPFSRSRE